MTIPQNKPEPLIYVWADGFQQDLVFVNGGGLDLVFDPLSLVPQVILEFDDGTILETCYEAVETWRIEVHKKGSHFLRHVPLHPGNPNPYSELVVLAPGIKGVTQLKENPLAHKEEE